MLTRPDRLGVRQPRKIRFTDAEWALVVQRARLCGRAPARYVREVVLGAAPRPSRVHANDAVVRELTRLGNVLAALDRHARDSGEPSRTEPLDRALTAVLDAVRRLG